MAGLTDGRAIQPAGETMVREAGELALAIDEAKAWLRMATADEDATVAGLVRAATAMCEAFTGQLLTVRECTTTLAASGDWQRLGAVPVRALVGIERVGTDGTSAPVDPDGYVFDIDAGGDGWLRMAGGVTGGRIAVSYRAGIAEDANALPEALRQGILRMVAHLYEARSGQSARTDGAPPAAVTALWRPWRRMRL